MVFYVFHTKQYNIYQFIGWKIPVFGLRRGGGSNADFQYQRPRTAIELIQTKEKLLIWTFHIQRQILHIFHNTDLFIGQKTPFGCKNGGQKADFQD